MNKMLVARKDSDIPLADAVNRVLVQEPAIKTVAKHLLKLCAP